MDVLIQQDVDTHRVGGAGVLPHRPQAQAGGGAGEVPPHRRRHQDAQIDQDVVGKQGLAHHRDGGEQGDLPGGEAADQGVGACHDGPAVPQALADEEVEAQAEGGDGQAGDVLVGLEGDGEQGKQGPAQAGGQKGDQQAHQQAVGHTACQVAEDGADGHGALHAQIQAASLLGDDLAHCAVEQGDVHQHDVEQEEGQYVDGCVHLDTSLGAAARRARRKRVKKSAARTANRMMPWIRSAKLASMEE